MYINSEFMVDYAVDFELMMIFNTTYIGLSLRKLLTDVYLKIAER